MDALPVEFTSTHGHPAHGHQLPVDGWQDWQPAHSALVAEHDGALILLRACPADLAATLTWALYAREEYERYRWRMVDTGVRFRAADADA